MYCSSVRRVLHLRLNICKLPDPHDVAAAAAAALPGPTTTCKSAAQRHSTCHMQAGTNNSALRCRWCTSKDARVGQVCAQVQRHHDSHATADPHASCRLAVCMQRTMQPVKAYTVAVAWLRSKTSVACKLGCMGTGVEVSTWPSLWHSVALNGTQWYSPAVTRSLSQGSTAKQRSRSLCAGQLCKHTAPSRHPPSHQVSPGTTHGLLLLLLPPDAQVPYVGPLLLPGPAGKCEKSGKRCEGSNLGLLRSQNHSLPADGPRSPAAATAVAAVTVFLTSAASAQLKLAPCGP